MQNKINLYFLPFLFKKLLFIFCLGLSFLFSSNAFVQAKILSQSITVETKQPTRVQSIQEESVLVNPVNQNGKKTRTKVISINNNEPNLSENSISLINNMDIYALSPYAHQLILDPSSKRKFKNFNLLPNYAGLAEHKLKVPNADREKIAPWRDIIIQAAQRYNLDPALLAAIIKVESNFSPFALSSKGAQGLMQIMPQTQEYLGLSEPYDPQKSIMAGSAYLREQLDRFGTEELALAAYNAGPFNVMRYQSIPPFKETRKYVQKVMNYKNRIEVK